MPEKKIERTIDAAAVKALLPQDVRLKIAHLNLGVEVHHYTYTTAVSGSPGGQISGGGTAGGSYRTYDFGYDVENASDITMRIQFTIAKTAEDGYSLEKRYAWVDVSPGEKRRVWAGLMLKSGPELKAHIVTEVGVGPTPPEGHATWTEKTSPNKSLHEIFGLDKVALKLDDRQGRILVLGVLSWFCLGPFAAFAALIIAAKNRPLNTKGKVGIGLALSSLIIPTLFLIVYYMPGPTRNWAWVESLHDQLLQAFH